VNTVLNPGIVLQVIVLSFAYDAKVLEMVIDCKPSKWRTIPRKGLKIVA